MCLIKASDGTCIELAAAELILGRNPPSAAGKISDQLIVGRQHCKISVIDGSYYITDLKSVNGTFLNGARLDANKPVKLEENAQIRIANENLFFKESR